MRTTYLRRYKYCEIIYDSDGYHIRFDFDKSLEYTEIGTFLPSKITYESVTLSRTVIRIS